MLERIQSSGEAFVSNAVVNGRYLLRSCIVNFHTTESDVDALPEIVAGTGRAVDAEMRRRGRDGTGDHARSPAAAGPDFVA